MLGAKQRFHFLYRTTNKVNGKYYIGVHTTWNLDDGYLGSGKRLTRSVRKYGRENFVCEVIQFFDSREDAYLAEAAEVASHLGSALCMNLHPGGNGGWSEATKRRKWLRFNDPEWVKRKNAEQAVRSKAMHERDPMITIRAHDVVRGKPGKSHDQSTKDRIGAANAIAQRGERNSQHGTVWVTDGSVSMKVKQTDLQLKLNEGWRRGRKMGS